MNPSISISCTGHVAGNACFYYFVLVCCVFKGANSRGGRRRGAGRGRAAAGWRYGGNGQPKPQWHQLTPCCCCCNPSSSLLLPPPSSLLPPPSSHLPPPSSLLPPPSSSYTSSSYTSSSYTSSFLSTSFQTCSSKPSALFVMPFLGLIFEKRG